MIFEAKQILVTVKTYPNPSTKYGETVCVAGIDLETDQWIRLYPIPYRDLADDKKFPKYAAIEVKAAKASTDKRPESYKVDADSIRRLDFYDTKKDKKWDRRKAVLMSTASPSFCDILSKSESDDKSLGMFKPKNVQFSYEKIKPKDFKEHELYYAQLNFYNKIKKALETIPFIFRYSFSCYGTSDCPGHTLAIIDWEIVQSYRSWRWKYRDESVLLEKIKERWLDMCSDKKDTYFFVGNMKRLRDIFMILGVFYPPKI